MTNCTSHGRRSLLSAVVVTVTMVTLIDQDRQLRANNRIAINQPALMQQLMDGCGRQSLLPAALEAATRPCAASASITLTVTI